MSREPNVDGPPIAWIKRVHHDPRTGEVTQVVVDCPHCGREHCHGPGAGPATDRELGTRVPHCAGGSRGRPDYLLRYPDNVLPFAPR